ncbi:hypothetical protein BCV70DRAFT_214178 [Testicularia cyperi]|uniref:Rrp15p-domain-containing protein n=1 Tax=Testicularia cyperi TaxID=1882483 RepID=A0A317XX07_9BASI|nr:hypothetical protein BCV70DRAFT_214178 [Testicularia cyperi]
MAAGKFGATGAASKGGGGSRSKMTMRVQSAGPSTSTVSTSGDRKKGVAGANGKGKKVASSDDEDEDNYYDDAISLEGSDDDQDDGPDTEDEIEAAKDAGSKSKKTAKRKRRATSPTSFGNALEGLLGITATGDLDVVNEEEAHAADEGEKDNLEVNRHTKRRTIAKSESQLPPAILSLAPHLRRSAQSTTLSARAARIALEQRRRREERCHVKDVIGGWGPPGVLPPLEDEDGNIIETTPSTHGEAEKLQDWASQGGSQGYERKLRKVAQRGVVKLFNAIRAAQTTTEDDLHEAESKQSSSAAATTSKSTKAVPGAGSALKSKKAALAGKEARLADLSKSNFLDLIKKSSGSKSTSVAAK